MGRQSHHCGVWGFPSGSVVTTGASVVGWLPGQLATPAPPSLPIFNRCLCLLKRAHTGCFRKRRKVWYAMSTLNN